jgi:ribosome-associated protein
MTPGHTGAQARPELSGPSTIVSITDMPNTTPAEAGSVHELILDQLDQDQAQDLVTIPLEGKSSIADHMVIASGRSTRQVAAMATKLAERLKREGHGTPRIEGLPAADWVLIDAGDVVVHLFRPEVRSFYNLERMWGFGDDAVAAGGRA